MKPELLLFLMLNGIVWGFIVALISLGLSLIFGLLRMINVAHGAIYMLGAVTAWYMVNYTNNFWIGLITAPIVWGITFSVIERVLLHRIEESHDATIIATFGLMLLIEQAALAIFGGTPERIIEPIHGTIRMFGFEYSKYRIFVAIISLIVLGIIAFGLTKTKWGMWVRAVQQNSELALNIGVPTERVYALTFGLGAAIAAFAGVLAAPIAVVEFRMGVDILALAFIVVIVGGLGSLVGSVAAALLISLMEGLSAAFLSPTGARVLSLLVMAVIVYVKPFGLFIRTRESLINNA